MGWNLKSDRPNNAQLNEQIQKMIVSGLYPNTMQRALSQLEADGLLYTQRTSGRYVTEDVERIMQTKRSLATGLVKEFLESMGHLGFDRQQTIELLQSLGDSKRDSA